MWIQGSHIDLDRTRVGGVWLRRATIGYLCAASSTVIGRIDLQGSTITGELDLMGTLVRPPSPDEVMIDLSDAQVGKTVLTPATDSMGLVSLHARIGTLQDLSEAGLTRNSTAPTVLLTLGTLYFSALRCGTTALGTEGICPLKPGEHPTWDPFLYALDLLIPPARESGT
ncbi:hypothetical protein GCM10022419_111480 [Nonomuraea rosea]|uniref:Pentapeptide repeat-containing protein n=1 Tax=Nonomuraea rosea TaxID=638574 RepID=A0ABP6ZFQ4_9ACTN